MANLEDIVAATKIMSEDPESEMDGSGSTPKENRTSFSYLRKCDGVSDAVVSEPVLESEVILESNVEDKLGDSGGGNDEFGVNSANENGECKSIGDKQLNETGTGTDSGVDGDGDGGGTGEKLKDRKIRFHAGDFVWGKIKSHPWWPGQVYDPKHASEFALKHKQDGRLLVGFFGDGSCSWCSPSQLIPFVDNFSEMSTDSNSKGFLNAMQKSTDEIGRLMELEITCNCIPKERKDSLAKPKATNSVMPELDVCGLSFPKYEPADVYHRVVQLAKVVSVGNALDLAVLRSRLSAFYYFNGGHLLPVYHEPLDIEGLEDKSEDANYFSVPIEVPISSGPQETKVFHKRKQRSVAEIMGEDRTIKPESRNLDSLEQDTDVEKFASDQKRNKDNDGEVKGAGSEHPSSTAKNGRKRKSEVSRSPRVSNALEQPRESRNADSLEQDTDVEKFAAAARNRNKDHDGEVKGAGSEQPLSTAKNGRKRESEVSRSPRLSNALEQPRESRNLDSLEQDRDVEKFVAARNRNKGHDGEVEGSGSQQPLSTAKNGRKRKSEVLRSPRLSNALVQPRERRNIDSLEQDRDVASTRKRNKDSDGEVKGAGSEQPSSTAKNGRKRKSEVSRSPRVSNAKDDGENGSNGGEVSRKPKKIDVASEAREESETATTPRERKKSKYLSPPYTNLAWRLGNSSFKSQSQVENGDATGTTQTGEQKEERENAADQKSVDNESCEKLSNSQLETPDTSVNTDIHTAKNTEKLSFPVSDVDVPVDELLSEIQHAALDPFYLSKKGSLDKIWGFVSALRSSTYMHGLDYKLYQKRIAGENQEIQPSELKHLRNELTEKKTKSPDESSPRASKKRRTSDTCMSKKAAPTNDATATTEMVEGKDLPCLTLAFNPEARFPSNKEVVELFANTKETKVETDSHSVRTVYTNESDAEAAFKSSSRQSPFGSENVNYRLLQRSEAGTKGTCADDLLCDVNTMRQKLEITTALLENYHSKFSSKDKSNVKEEMKRLLEKVEIVGDKVRAIAEKSSSI